MWKCLVRTLKDKWRACGNERPWWCLANTPSLCSVVPVFLFSFLGFGLWTMFVLRVYEMYLFLDQRFMIERSSNISVLLPNVRGCLRIPAQCNFNFANVSFTRIRHTIYLIYEEMCT